MHEVAHNVTNSEAVESIFLPPYSPFSVYIYKRELIITLSQRWCSKSRSSGLWRHVMW